MLRIALVTLLAFGVSTFGLAADSAVKSDKPVVKEEKAAKKDAKAEKAAK